MPHKCGKLVFKGNAGWSKYFKCPKCGTIWQMNRRAGTLRKVGGSK